MTVVEALRKLCTESPRIHRSRLYNVYPEPLRAVSHKTQLLLVNVAGEYAAAVFHSYRRGKRLSTGAGQASSTRIPAFWCGDLHRHPRGAVCT